MKDRGRDSPKPARSKLRSDRAGDLHHESDMRRIDIVLVLGLLAAACSPEQLAGQVTRGAVSGGSEQLTREDTRILDALRMRKPG